MLKRLTVAALIAASIIVLAPTAQAKEGRWRGPCEGWWMGENLTPAIWNEDPARGEQMMMRLIVCTFAVWAPGESAYALAIADRESSFYPWAANPSGCLGLFQHQVAYWSGRVQAYLWKGWWGPNVEWPVSPYDPRANAIAAARMVHDSGWGPWGG
jgi:hypothetical protein